MSPPLFFVDRDRLAGDVITLDGAEGQHAATVRRVRQGERVDVGDGAGTIAEGEVVAAVGRTVALAVRRRRGVPPTTVRLVVVQALAKGEWAERAVELMTEIGVDEIVPWAAARSVARWEGERGARALARWRATAREASKQSRRAWLPVVSELAATDLVVERLRVATQAIVLHETAQRSLADVRMPTCGEVVVVVGPEGGLTEDELAAFGGPPYRLGPTVLRSATAGVAAAAVLLAASPRWR